MPCKGVSTQYLIIHQSGFELSSIESSLRLPVWLHAMPATSLLLFTFFLLTNALE
jgi:hypothetical protein